MTTTMVHVTEKDIADGERCNGTLCPVARALKRATGINWAVGPRSVTSLVWGGETAALPFSASDFIRQFDDECLLQPFSFEFTTRNPVSPA